MESLEQQTHLLFITLYGKVFCPLSGYTRNDDLGCLQVSI